MFKTNVRLACLFSVLAPTVLCFNALRASADDAPTRLHQHLHKIDYTPARIGLTVLGQPLVHVKINGTVDAIFLVDTGTNNSMMNADLAKRLGLRLQPAVGSDGAPATWKGKQAMMTQVSLFEIGNVQSSNVPFIVLDPSSFHQFQATTSEGVCDGVIGVNILGKSAIYLDGPQHKFGFCLPGAVSPQQLSQAGLPQPYIIPLTTNSTASQWFIRAELTAGSNSSSEDLLLDTGSNTTAVSGRLAQDIHLRTEGQVRQDDIYGTSVVSSSQVDVLRMGSLTLRNFPIVMRRMFGGEPPVIGMDILSGYRVLIDFPGKKMYLQPNTATVPTITIKPQTPSVPVGNAGH